MGDGGDDGGDLMEGGNMGLERFLVYRSTIDHS